MDESTIQTSKKYTVLKLKEILKRIGIASDKEIDRIKLKGELISLYKSSRSTRKNNTLESLMEKLSLGTLTSEEEIRLQQMMK